MATSPRIRNTPGCEIELQGEHLRVAVGPALSDEVQECYHAFANECVTRTLPAFECARTSPTGPANEAICPPSIS